VLDAKRPHVRRDERGSGHESQLLADEQADDGRGERTRRVGVQNQSEPDARAVKPLGIPRDRGEDVGATRPTGGEAHDVVLRQARVLEEACNDVGVGVEEQPLEEVAVGTAGERFPLAERKRSPRAVIGNALFFRIQIGQESGAWSERLTDEPLERQERLPRGLFPKALRHVLGFRGAESIDDREEHLAGRLLGLLRAGTKEIEGSGEVGDGRRREDAGHVRDAEGGVTQRSGYSYHRLGHQAGVHRRMVNLEARVHQSRTKRSPLCWIGSPIAYIMSTEHARSPARGLGPHPFYAMANDPPKKSPTAPTPRRDEETEVLDRPKAQTPRLYKVVFHNDDYTTMEFVIEVLRVFFHKSETEATFIMLTVHKKGSAVAATYTRDVAETKVSQVMKHARERGMPLLVTAEPE
jgi:ATP-dependent Clp protease adaptor protein ClpS